MAAERESSAAMAALYGEAFELPWDLRSQSQLRRHHSLPPPISTSPSDDSFSHPSSLPYSNSPSPFSPRPHRSPPTSPCPPPAPASSLYRLNLSLADSFPPESMASPRISDVGGLFRFLPSNNEPDEEDLTALSNALRLAVGGGSPGGAVGGAAGEPGSHPHIQDMSVYSSDEFRIYEFKVRRCMRGRSHDWTDCPFAHPGEKARRRDPRRYHYSGTACPDFRKGACRRGDACEYAHGVFECWLHPARYRTQPCKDGRNCKRRVCFFAHSNEQLRLLPAAAAAQSLAAQGGAGGGGGHVAQCGGTGLSPTSTLAAPNPNDTSPGCSPPATPKESPPGSPPLHERAMGGGAASGVWGGAAMAAAGPAPQSLSSPRFFMGVPSPRGGGWGLGGSALPPHPSNSFVNGSPLSPGGVGGSQGGMAQGQLLRSLNGAPVGVVGAAASAAIRQRQLERFHSLPALAIPGGVDGGSLSLSSPYAAPSPSHHRLALMQAAAAAVAASAGCGSPGGYPCPSSPNVFPSSPSVSEQHQGSRAAMMSDLVANLQALEVQPGGPKPWQNQAQVQMEMEAQVRAQILQAQAVRAQWQAQQREQMREDLEAQVKAQVSMQQQQQQLMAAAASLRQRSGGSMCEAVGSKASEQAGAAGGGGNGSEGDGGIGRGREFTNDAFFESADFGVGGEGKESDLSWVSDLVKDESVGAGPYSRTSGSSRASNPWADVGHWVPTANA